MKTKLALVVFSSLIIEALNKKAEVLIQYKLAVENESKEHYSAISIDHEYYDELCDYYYALCEYL